MSFNPLNNPSLNNKTTLIITLHKTKLVQTSSTPPSYSLSLSLSNSSQFTTEKISSHLYSFNQHNNTFYFKTNLQSLFQSFLLIQAITTSWFLFNSTIAQITLPISLNHINTQREWFYLKNENDENVIGVLISFQCDDIQSIKTQLTPQINKTEISITHCTQNINLHEKPKNICESKKRSNTLNVNKLIELLSHKHKHLCDIENKNKIQQLNNNIADDRLKENERILSKENNKLLERIRKSKLNLNEYETKTINLAQQAIKYEKIQNREHIINDIINYNTDMNLCLSTIYNYSYNTFHLQTKSLCILDKQVSEDNNLSLQINIDTLSNVNFKQKQPNAILDHNSLVYHSKLNKNQRQDPAKKSNSTYMTTTQNTSEASINEYLINKPPMISQIYLNTSGINNDIAIDNGNMIRESLESVTNKKVMKRKTVTNHSYLNYSNLMSNNGDTMNNVNVNLITNNNSNNNYSHTIRKSSIKRKHVVKEEHLIVNTNSNNNQINNRCKKRKQTVISLTSHKPLNKIYTNGQNVVGLFLGNNQCSTTRKSKKHISLKKI